MSRPTPLPHETDKWADEAAKLMLADPDLFRYYVEKKPLNGGWGGRGLVRLGFIEGIEVPQFFNRAYSISMYDQVLYPAYRDAGNALITACIIYGGELTKLI